MTTVHQPENPAPASSPPLSPKGRSASTVGAIMFFAVLSAGYGLGFWIVPGAERFGVSITQFLLWYSIWTIGTAIAFVPIGKLMTIFGVKLIAIITSAAAMVILVAMAFVSSIGWFYVLAAALGVAWGGFTMLAANTLITGWHEKRRGTILGIAAASSGVVGVLYGFIFPPILATWGFTGVVLAMAVHVAVLGLIPAVFLVTNPPRLAAALGADAASRNKRKRTPFDRIAVIVTIIAAVGAVCFTLEATFSQVLPTVFGAAGFDPGQVGMFVSYYALCSTLATPILGLLVDKLGLKVAYVAMTLLFVAGTPAIAFFQHSGAWAFWVFLPIAAMSVAVSAIVLPIVTSRAVGTERFPVAFGAVAGGQWLGLAVATPVWGAIYEATGSFDLAMYFAGLAGLTGLALAASVPVIASRAKRRRAATPVAVASQ